MQFQDKLNKSSHLNDSSKWLFANNINKHTSVILFYNVQISVAL